MMTKSRWILVGAAVLVVVVGAVFAFRKPKYTVVGKVEKGVMIESVYGIATITAEKIYNLKVAQPGVVNRVDVREGQTVKKGASLLTFEGTTFRSPIDGIVALVTPKDGEAVTPQTQIVTVFDPSHLYCVVSLEQQGALKVRPGQTAKISFDSIRNQVFEGSVFSVYAQGTQFKVRIDAKSLPSGVLPGMTADVAIEVARHADRIIAPAAGVSGTDLVILNGRRLSRIPVKTGLADASKVEIIEGNVEVGSTVVTPK